MNKIKLLAYKICKYFSTSTTSDVDLDIFFGIKNGDLSPKFCGKCGNNKFGEKAIDYINGEICEKDIICDKCKYCVGYWSYGYYQP